MQHLTTLPSKQLFPTERQIKGVGPTVFHEKKNGQHRYTYLVLGLDIFYFLKNTLILRKSSVKLMSSTCSNFDWQHICYVWWTCFSTDSIHIDRHCAPLLANVFLYTHEGGFIPGLHKKNEKKLARSFNFTFRCLDDVLSLLFLALWFRWSHLYHWAWNTKYDGYIYACFIPLLTCRNWQWGAVKNETLRQKRLFQFSLCELHLYAATFQQHLHIEYISISWYDIPELVVPIWISLITGVKLMTVTVITVIPRWRTWN